MRRSIYFTLAVLGIVALGAIYIRRETLRRQWACYQVTSAASYAAFGQQMAQFQTERPDADSLRLLVQRWHTGNEAFDEHLARYLFDPACGDTLRETFSRELSWRSELPAAWAEQWRQLKPDVEQQTATLRRYLEALHAAQPPREITWRDVLDFQAALELAGQGALAHRLTPENWRSRYERWEAMQRTSPPQ